MLLFKPENKEMILAGKKTSTRRVWRRKNVKVGRTYKARLKLLSKDYFAKIRVKKFYKQRLGEMKKEDFEKEGYENPNDFIRNWAEITGSWDKGLAVHVIEFEVVE